MNDIVQKNSFNKYHKENILFYVNEVAHFWGSVKPLFNLYIEKSVNCIVVFPDYEIIKQVGMTNLKRLNEIMCEIVSRGGHYYFWSEWEVYKHDYYICYTYSDYIKMIGPEIRKCCRYIVALQTTAFYTHIYVGVSNSKVLFDDAHSKNIDYLVVSKFIADWISERSEVFRDKLLRFGYPRFDDLYNKLNEPTSIPSEWKKKIQGNKVFLAIGAKDFPHWIANVRGGVVIYRPHPFCMDKEMKTSLFKELKMNENVIIDDSDSYYNAFKISDALICPVLCSVHVNYHLTNKPVLLLDRNFDSRKQHVSTYKNEIWYKSSYIAENAKDIEQFTAMICNGEDNLKKIHEPFQKSIQIGFDGKVCERILNYFENLDL